MFILFMDGVTGVLLLARVWFLVIVAQCKGMWNESDAVIIIKPC